MKLIAVVAATFAFAIAPKAAGATTPNLEIVLAAKDGDIEGLYSALLEGGSARQKDVSGVSALQWAVAKNRYGACRMLLANGADTMDLIERPPTGLKEFLEGDTLLHLAARHASVGILQLLLTQPQLPDVDTQNSIAETPLIVAAEKGRGDIFLDLLEAGSNVNIKGGAAKATPIWYIAARGHHDLWRAIMEERYPFEIDATARDGTTALIAAVRQDYSYLVEDLIEAGADVHIKDNQGKSARDYASSQRMRDLLYKQEVFGYYLRLAIVGVIALIIFSVVHPSVQTILPKKDWAQLGLAPSIAVLFSAVTVLYSWQYTGRLVELFGKVEAVSLQAINGFFWLLGIAMFSWISWRTISSLFSTSSRSR